MIVAEMIGQEDNVGILNLLKDQLKNELNIMCKMIKQNYVNIPNESLEYIKEAKLNSIDELISEHVCYEIYLEPSEEELELFRFFNEHKQEVCNLIDSFMR